MADFQAVIPIVNGGSVLFYGLGNQTTIVVNGTTYTALMQDVQLWGNNGQIGITGNPLIVEDPLVETNLGSIVAQNTTIISNQTSEISNTGSINLKVATAANQTTEIANQVSLIAQTASLIASAGSNVANTGSIVAELASIGTQLAGTLLDKPGLYNINALSTGTITNAGTAVVILAAGQCAAGGFLRTENAAGFYYTQGNGNTATQVAASPNIFSPGGVTSSLIPNAGSVTVISGVAGLLIEGVGLT